MGQECLGLACKDDTVIQWRVPQRLLTEAITGEKKGSRGAVVDRKGEHAVEEGEHPWSVAAVEVQKNLGVALRVEAGAVSGQVAAKLLEVVDFAVERDGKVAIVAGHWLVGFGYVDDAKAVDGQGAAVVVREERAGLVGPTMSQVPAHVPGEFEVGAGGWVAKLSCESAHAGIVVCCKVGCSA